MFMDTDLSTVYNDRKIYIQNVYVIQDYIYTHTYSLNQGNDGVLEQKWLQE